MIHYHGTPFSGDFKATMALATHHAMVSFEAPKSLEIVAEVCQSFCLDNGAFSAWKRGAEYNPSAMVKWAEPWLRHPGCDWAIAPDIIKGRPGEDGAAMGRRNDSLLQLVLPNKDRWVPVWHLHETLERLERLAHEWPRVAFGSSGDYAEVGNRLWWDRMSEAMEVVTDDDGFPITKLHGLRMLDPTIFSFFPFASADSTNVARNIGIDQAWKGPYAPQSRYMRALILMERTEAHASAIRWSRATWPRNHDLFG